MSSFSVTCSRLRQYIKQRGGGSLADVAVTLLPPPPTTTTTTTTTTMNLLPGLELEEEVADKSRQLTIFYGGKVLVFDKFPEDKAEDLMKMASSGSSAASTPPVGDLPIARKRSLHRFLEKRQERNHSNEPYQLNGCPQPLPNKAKLTHSWLGLGEDSVPLVEE